MVLLELLMALIRGRGRGDELLKSISQAACGLQIFSSNIFFHNMTTHWKAFKDCEHGASMDYWAAWATLGAFHQHATGSDFAALPKLHAGRIDVLLDASGARCALLEAFGFQQSLALRLSVHVPRAALVAALVPLLQAGKLQTAIFQDLVVLSPSVQSAESV